MKSAGAIRHQLKQVSFRYLKKLVEAKLKVRPHNCTFNEEIRHPKVIAEDGPPLRVCIFPDLDQPDRVCDALWGGVEKAKECPFFQPNATKDEIKDEFKDWLATSTLAEVASKYPDMAALLWVLQDEAPDREVEIPEDEDWEAEDTEEEYTVTINGVVLRAASSEEAKKVLTELEGIKLALDTSLGKHKQDREALESQSNHIATLTEENTLLNGENESLTQANASLRADLEAKSRDHEHVSGQVAELRRQLQDRVELPAPRVSWWARLFGGGS